MYNSILRLMHCPGTEWAGEPSHCVVLCLKLSSPRRCCWCRHFWHRKGDVFHLLLNIALVLDDRCGAPPAFLQQRVCWPAALRHACERDGLRSGSFCATLAWLPLLAAAGSDLLLACYHHRSAAGCGPRRMRIRCRRYAPWCTTSQVSALLPACLLVPARACRAVLPAGAAAPPA